MSAIFHLSKYILLPIYNEWLDASDFCHMDTAICNHLERQQFLQLIGHECVKFPGLVQDAVCTKCLKWVAARKMRITHLIIEKQLLVRIFVKSLPSFANLKHLVVNNYDTGFSERLKQLLTVCTQLESFHLSTSKFLGSEIIETLSQNCKHLTSMDLGHKTNTGRIYLSDEVMNELAKSCPCLTAVKLVNFMNLTGNFFASLANECKLKVLSIKNMPLLTAEPLDLLVDRCPDMSVLSVKDCKLITGNDFSRILAKCSELTTVCLRTDNNYDFDYSTNTETPPQLLSIDALMHAVHITTLKLCSVYVSNEVLEVITITCSKLVTLEVTRQDYLTQDGLMHIAKHCSHLTELSLSLCYGLTDVVVVAVATVKLTRLNLNSCPLLTDISLQHIVNTCHNLTSLSIGGNQSYTLSKDVYVHLLSSCPKLLYLDVSDTYYTIVTKPKYTKRNGEVVNAKVKRTREPYMLFTEAIKPDTSLRVLRLIGMKMKHGVISSLKETHKTLKIVHSTSWLHYDDSVTKVY